MLGIIAFNDAHAKWKPRPTFFEIPKTNMVDNLWHTHLHEVNWEGAFHTITTHGFDEWGMNQCSPLRGGVAHDLKKWMWFVPKYNTRPTPKAMTATTMLPKEENNGTRTVQQTMSELNWQILQLQGWMNREGGDSRHPNMKKHPPYLKYPCSICGQQGHNSMSCELRPLMLDMFPDMKAKFL